ncbi:hypothetical protein KKH15_01780, partial [Patescibacteria group bacterium]|nr:hypothetical protein [Patescibacteria group bacterium]MBU1754778.1 hypothetical protein [Patescibacteria group bacterium]
LLFGLAVFLTLSNLSKAYLVAHDVPLAFTLTPRLSLEWFYLPVTAMTLLAVVAAIGSIIFIIIGKHVSQTPSKIGFGIVGYLLVYGLVAPFWLLRAMFDVATGTRRAWR